jgi:hypothetical protein
MIARLVGLAMALLALTGCATNRPLTDEGLALVVRIAVRHAIADSERAQEKAHNIRAAVVRLQLIADSETTVGALKAEVMSYMSGLDLTELQRSDAVDVLDYFAAVLEGQIGPERFDNVRAVRVQEFLALILSALPADPVIGVIQRDPTRHQFIPRIVSNRCEV